MLLAVSLSAIVDRDSRRDPPDALSCAFERAMWGAERVDQTARFTVLVFRISSSRVTIVSAWIRAAVRKFVLRVYVGACSVPLVLKLEIVQEVEIFENPRGGLAPGGYAIVTPAAVGPLKRAAPPSSVKVDAPTRTRRALRFVRRFRELPAIEEIVRDPEGLSMVVGLERARLRRVWVDGSKAVVCTLLVCRVFETRPRRLLMLRGIFREVAVNVRPPVVPLRMACPAGKVRVLTQFSVVAAIADVLMVAVVRRVVPTAMESAARVTLRMPAVVATARLLSMPK
jgi:hypothetical protein